MGEVPAVYTRGEIDVNVISTRCEEGNKQEKESFLCRFLNSNSDDCSFQQKTRFKFTAVAQGPDNEIKKMCVNVCLKCPLKKVGTEFKRENCNTNKQYMVNVIELKEYKNENGELKEE